MVSDSTRRTFRGWVGGLLIMGTSVVSAFLLKLLTGEQSLFSMTSLGVLVAGIILTFLNARWQARSAEESSEVIKEQVGQLHSELRSRVQSRSYGARSKLIAAPLKELDLDITPRVGWVRDPRLTEPEPISEKNTDIVATFTSSKRRLLIVGEPGAGKTTAAYALIEYLHETEGDERIPLLVNLSAWEAQENFEAFLVDYLVSEVGYQVRQPAIASTFISSRRYSLILDGLDEIPAGLRAHFSERLDEFVRGLPSEVAVVVTCRTQEYQELIAAHPTGLGLVQAVEILPLTSQQLDSAFVELAKYDEDWETFMSQQHLVASQRARDVLSNPLFLNLAVAGRLHPGELLNCDEEQELRDLVLEKYLDRVLADQSEYEPKDIRRYLTWIARFLNGAEVSPFGLRTSDPTVFDLAELTPPEPPRLYRRFGVLVTGLVGGLAYGLINGLAGGLESGLIIALVLVYGTVSGLVFGLFLRGIESPLVRGPYSAVSSRLSLSWASTRQQLLGFLREGRLGLRLVLVYGLLGGLLGGLANGLVSGLVWAMVLGLFGLVLWLGRGRAAGFAESRFMLISSRTPKEAVSRSRFAALIWVALGFMVGVLVTGVVIGVLNLATSLEGTRGMAEMLWMGLIIGLIFGPIVGLGLGLSLGLSNGGWFVLLQKVAHRRLARAGNLPRPPADFLEWGIERQIFRRVGGGVRFRHSLIQQHLANT